jgi:membrane associated rhomboid family serine protease
MTGAPGAFLARRGASGGGRWHCTNLGIRGAHRPGDPTRPQGNRQEPGISVSHRQPIFNAPTVVIAVASAFLAVHLVRALLPMEADEQVLQLLAFVPGRLGVDATGVTQLVTHIFLHGNLPHLLVNTAWFLAFATPVARRIGALRFLGLFLLCGIGGALLFVAFHQAPMVGASGAISGLMGAALRFLFLPMKDGDADALAGDTRPPLVPLSQALTDRRILIAVIGWTALNVLAARGTELVLDDMRIAWEAHLGGFFTGFLLFGLFDRGAIR